ncbi:hypothetical protein HPB50_027597 [Hyalomma asiaticum]|uniref:Uncharacterized protein n=1 Tax=Hyalomma asiaticum TaxID=266040 RepID=A0ACB7T4X0_HYAAI|nr:hypothetical protein HPB50_027597 [Hyalomma asiaticum]
MRTLAKEGRLLPPTLEEPPPSPAAASDASEQPAPSVPPRSVKARSPFSRLTLHATDAGAALFRHKSPSKSPTRSVKSPPPKGKQQQQQQQQQTAAQHADRSRQPTQHHKPQQQPSSHNSDQQQHSKGAHHSAASFARGLRFQLKRRNTSAFAGQLRPDPGPAFASLHRVSEAKCGLQGRFSRQQQEQQRLRFLDWSSRRIAVFLSGVSGASTRHSLFFISLASRKKNSCVHATSPQRELRRREP